MSKYISDMELLKKISDLKIDFAIELNKLMKEKNITQKELAAKSKKSKSLISRILGGDSNLTIETMVELYHGLDESLVITKKELLNQSMTISHKTFDTFDANWDKNVIKIIISPIVEDKNENQHKTHQSHKNFCNC